MSNVRFNLHKHAGGTIIRLVFRYAHHKFVYYPGINVNPSNWNSKAMRIRKGADGWKEVNAGLDRLEQEVLRLYRESQGAGIITTAQLKIDPDCFWKGKEPGGKAPDVSQFIRQSTAERVSSGQIRASTGKALETLAVALDRFKRGITFEEINLDFHAKFTAFLIGEKKSPNTIAGTINRLKRLMSEAVDKGLTNTQSFRSNRFTAKWIEVDNIYLNETDLALIERVDLSGKPGHIKARDLFLLGAYTGLRYSDFSTLEPGDFQTYDGVFMVRKRMQKTSRVVAAPINKEARVILDRYDMKPPSMSNQVLNRYIKEVAKWAGVTDLVKVDQIRGGVTKTQMFPKWKMVSTHTARRTFATLGYLRAVAAGRDYEPIMDVIGHKNRATFLNYIKVSAEEKAVLWAKASEGL